MRGAKNAPAVGHSLARELRWACSCVLIVEPWGRVQILGCATQIKNRPKRSVLNPWRIQKDSNPQSSDP